MRCHPLRWLWGLPLVLMWFWIAFLSERDPIKYDLQERARQALESAGHGWAVTTFAGRDGTIGGRANSVSGREAAEQIVRDVWGVRVVDNRAALLEEVDDYLWSATTSDDGILLSGYVPSEDAHARVMKYVKADFPDAAIDDELELARGVPELARWLSGIRFGLHQLKRLKSGRLELNRMQLSLSGVARSFADYKDVRTALRGQMPRGIRLGSDDVSPPIVSPYGWSAVRDGRQLVLAGHVPSEKARKALFDHAKDSFRDFAIIDRMETAAGAHEGWEDATKTLVRQLAALDSGSARIKDADLVLEGHAESKDLADTILVSVEEVVSDHFDATFNITFPEPRPTIISPFLTSIDVEKLQIRVFGYVPSEEMRAQLIDFIKTQFSTHEIIDELKLGSGAPADWYECLKAGLEGVQQLGIGQIRVLDQELKLVGTTEDEAVAEALPGRVRAAANRACEVQIDLKLNLPPEPKLSWSIINDGRSLVTLDGEVPDGETRDALIEAAQLAFPTQKVDVQMSVVPGYGTRWRRVSLMGVRLLKRLRLGTAIISGNELLVRGESADTAIANAIEDQLKNNIANGYVGRAEITVRSDAMIWAELEARRRAGEDVEVVNNSAGRYVDAPGEEPRIVEDRDRASVTAEERRRSEEAERARQEWAEERRRRANEEREARARREEDRLAAFRIRRQRELRRRKKADKCQEALRSAAREGVIRFAFASHKLTRRSFPTLNNLASVAKSCPSFVIEISGHTDSKGTDERNLALSERRAQSVVDFLVDAGVANNRLEAVGYGESQPVAPNTTKANRAKNRRIEFYVRDE